MKIIDAAKFEKLLVDEHRFLTRMFNTNYAGTIQLGNNVIKGQILAAKCDLLQSIIEALQESTIEGGY